MKNESIWKNVLQKPVYSKLNKDINVDVLIIGGGITGISTLYHLSNSNMKVCLVEKNSLCSGVTCRTTGKLTYLQGDIYTKIKKYCGIDKAKLYLESQIDAIDMVKDIVNKHNISCDLEKVKSYVFSNSDSYSLDKDFKVSKEIGIDVKKEDKLPSGDKVYDAYYARDTYVFHPLKYLYSIIEKCSRDNTSIFENTKIISIEKDNELFICKTHDNIIKTKYVVLAFHYPYFLFPFLMPFKTYIEKSYISAFKVKKNYKYSSISTSKPIVSMRYHKEDDVNYKIYLTNSHSTCFHDNYKDNFKALLKDRKLSYIWSNKDIITSDLLPFIGGINKDNTLLIGTGYNTWGMTNGSLAGKIISDIILKNDNKYISLFDPLRGINLGKIIKYPIILGSNIISFTKSRVYKQKKWYPSNVKFEKRNGKDVAIYVDSDKKEHIVYNKCPHLKCGLIFNEIEKTWDCPCHGSRFDIDGNCIEGPSNYDIKYKD